MSSERDRIRFSDAEAFILDLDGVVTDTASLHAKAWKRTFDELLKSRRGAEGEDLRPFEEEDYRRHVDGKPRYDGVRSFLESRGIELEEGSPSDAPDRDTVHGLGNRKNALFGDDLTRGEIDVYEDAVRAVRRWKREGRKLAVVSSSRNCAAVLRAAELDDLFETRVDGKTLGELGLSGKPAPDAFLEAARRLDVAPGRAAIFEDALSGVEAGRAGGFGVVVGVDRSGRTAEALREGGADLVIESFDELEPPELLDRDACLDELERRLESVCELALFLDYDGTLTRIVDDPEEAKLSAAARSVLEALASRLPVAIVSGRDLEDLKRHVGLPSVVYAGSHGFDIAGPNGFREEHEEGKDCLPALDEAESELRERLEGARVERKRYAIAVHYRGLGGEQALQTKSVVEEVASRFTKLRLTGGKKIFELRPALDWDKGKAVLWLMKALRLSLDKIVPVYIGDDVTDEDAFRALARDGLGIFVGPPGVETAARGRLEDVSEVESFLSALVPPPETVR